MLVKQVPIDIPILHPCSEEDTLYVDCGDGYCAVKRPYQKWVMETVPTQDQQFRKFFKSTNKTEELKDIMKKWQVEYAECVKDGAVLVESSNLYYISYPDLFEGDIKWVMQFDGELPLTDQAWIKNTRELIEKYHTLFEEEIERLYR
jgi:hypothetical protein